MTPDTLQLAPSPLAPRTPMAAAALVYNDDNSVAWDRMWDTF